MLVEPPFTCLSSLLIKLSGVEKITRLAVHPLPQRTSLFALIDISLSRSAYGNGIELSFGILTFKLN